jgi:hypothetical protein
MNFQRNDFSLLSPRSLASFVYHTFLRKDKRIKAVRTVNVVKHISLFKLPIREVCVIPKDLYNIIEKRGIHIRACEVLISHHTIVLIDKAKLSLHRCSFNNLGREQIKNHLWFLINSNFNLCPDYISQCESNGCLIGSEQFIEGDPLNIEQISLGLFEEIFTSISILYREHARHIFFNLDEELNKYDVFLNKYFPLDWRDKICDIKKTICHKLSKMDLSKLVCKTLIHGDLTFRNILVKKEALFFLDLDCSEITFPEFDFYLFYTDLLTHQSSNITYRRFFDNIFKLVNYQLPMEKAIEFYQFFTCFRINKPIEMALRYLFLYRSLVLALLKMNKGNRVAIDLIDFVDLKLREAI